MTKQSAGLIMYRYQLATLEVLLVHPGGPFWSKKNHGVWSIPKGQAGDEEELLTAAQREFFEETGFRPEAPFLELGSIQQRGGKVVTAWAFSGDADVTQLKSNLCTIEWPPRSGTSLTIPEVDQARWFQIAEAREYILKGQASLLDILHATLLGQKTID